MSVRLNLLPDLRQAKLKEQGRKQLVTTIGIITCSVALGAVVVLGIYAGTQKVIISKLSDSIVVKEKDLTSTDGLTDALTGQAEVGNLPSLYAKRVYFSHFFKAYSEATPLVVAFSSLSIDNTNLLKVTGKADTYASVTKLARAMAADNVTIGTGALPTSTPYFTNITIESVSQDTTGTQFTLSANVGSGATNVKQ